MRTFQKTSKKRQKRPNRPIPNPICKTDLIVFNNTLIFVLLETSNSANSLKGTKKVSF
jgi:hypothetical protein